MDGCPFQVMVLQLIPLLGAFTKSNQVVVRMEGVDYPVDGSTTATGGELSCARTRVTQVWMSSQAGAFSLSFSASSKSQKKILPSWWVPRHKVCAFLSACPSEMLPCSFGHDLKLVNARLVPGLQLPKLTASILPEFGNGVCQRFFPCVGPPIPRSTSRRPHVPRPELPSQGFRTFHGLFGPVFTLSLSLVLRFYLDFFLKSGIPLPIPN